MPTLRSSSVGGVLREPAAPTSQPGTPTKRSSSVGFVAHPGTPKRKGTAADGRGGSFGASLGRLAGSLVVRGGASSTPPVLHVNVDSIFDTSVSVQLPGVKLEGGGALCVQAGKQGSVTYTSTGQHRSNSLQGNITIDGFEPLPISISHCKMGQTFISSKGRWRILLLGADEWDWKNNGDKPTTGQAAEVEISGVQAPVLRIQIRAASELELKRCLQLQAMREAERGTDYATLHAQIAKAKIAFVDLEHIEKAEARLRQLRQEGLHIGVGCDKDSIRQHFTWGKVTSRLDAARINTPCCNADCACNVEDNPGETLSLVGEHVQDTLTKGFGEASDRVLFDELVDAALAVEEGSVWRAGGKLIFSAFNRNQSVSALVRMLQNYRKDRCAKMLLEMVRDSEKKYGGFVTAVQINFHPHSNTYHDQHRDIYSAKQRGGANCTCQFRECNGTVCYTLGSSRVCRLDTCVDDMSLIKGCSEACTGRTEKVWLHSGMSMYFNGLWNTNHMHGIPAMEEDCGPRISMAFLLGTESPKLIDLGLA